MSAMKKVFICSPYRGDIHKNKQNALAYCRRAVAEGCMPYAPHLYFTRFLAESPLEEREMGIAAGLEWLRDCSEVWVFGQSTEGMRIEIAEAERLGKKVVYHDAPG